MPIRDEAFWDERYRSATRLWSGNPNPQLVAEAANLAPGAALDVGAGEGGDAIWLAERGWQVTALDLSSVALARGREHADERGAAIAGRISWLHADITTWQPPDAAFDLVSLQFLHFPSAQRAPVYRRVAGAVAPGGLLLVVGHHPSDLQTTAKRPSDPDLLFTPDEVAGELPGDWDILTREQRPRTGTDPDGASITVHDSVLLARRPA